MKIHKVCTKCSIDKPLSEYGKRSNVPDGKKSACKECLKSKGQDYYNRNKVKESLRKKKAYKENRDVMLGKQKDYYDNNKNKRAEWVKKKREEQPEVFNAYGKKYRKDHREKVNKYVRDRRKVDDMFRVTMCLRSRLNDALRYKSWKKDTKFSEYIGCSLVELKEHLAFQFQKEMNWKNHSQTGWHIDHIIPLSSAETEEELYKLCHYTNLQPLWALDNLKKGKKT